MGERGKKEENCMKIHQIGKEGSEDMSGYTCVMRGYVCGWICVE